MQKQAHTVQLNISTKPIISKTPIKAESLSFSTSWILALNVLKMVAEYNLARSLKNSTLSISMVYVVVDQSVRPLFV